VYIFFASTTGTNYISCRLSRGFSLPPRHQSTSCARRGLGSAVRYILLAKQPSHARQRESVCVCGCTFIVASMFSPDDIDTSKPCTCEITVDDVRIRFRKAEYQVVVRMTFHSNKSFRSKYISTWCIWRSFSAFRALDAQLRKRNTVHMKGIQFPPLYLRRRLFRTHLQPKFLETRRKSLDTYMTMVTQNPATVAFHVTSLESQSLKSFVSFTSGFVQNIVQQPTSANARSSNQPLFPKPSTASVSMMASYRWSGTGFLGSDHVNPRAISERPSSSFVRINPEQYNQSYMERQSFAGASSGLVLPLSSSTSLSSCRGFTSTRGAGDLYRHDYDETSNSSDNMIHRIDSQHEHRKESSSSARPPPHPTTPQRQVKTTTMNSRAIDANGGSSDPLRSSKYVDCESSYIDRSINLSITLSNYRSIDLSSTYVSIDLSICQSINPSTYISIYLSIYVSIYHSICLSIYRSITLSISTYISIYQSIYQSITLIELSITLSI
jgi:hypothetical protein